MAIYLWFSLGFARINRSYSLCSVELFIFDAAPVRQHWPGGSPLHMSATTRKKITRFCLHILNIPTNLSFSLYPAFFFSLLSLSALSSLTSLLLPQLHQVIFTVYDQAFQKKKETERKVHFFKGVTQDDKTCK